MIAKWILWAQVLFTTVIAAFNANAESDQTIRVRLMSLGSSLHVSGFSLSFQGEKEKSPLSLPQMQSVKIVHHKESDQDVWLVESEEKGELKRKWVRGNPLALRGNLMRVGRQLTPEHVLLFARETKESAKRVDVVAVVGIEKYLESVLAGEMPASWPLEALKAQAVASRSYALFNRNLKRSNHFHVESTIADQVFDFQGSRQLSSAYRLKIMRAVDETRGQVLVNYDHSILQSFYHSDCGGHTEKSGEVWSGRSNLGSVKDPYCASSPYAHWKYSLPRTVLEKKLRSLTLSREKIRNITVNESTETGRVRSLLLTVESGRNFLIKATTLRHRLGTTKLKSTNFSLALKGNQVIFVGKGYGHGVGLCQWGSKNMAHSGKDYREILHHYYGQARLLEIPGVVSPLAKTALRAPYRKSNLSRKENKGAKTYQVDKI